MYHINGWTTGWFKDELEQLKEGIGIMPEVETVFYQQIDRGVDLEEFQDYIALKYPKIKDLWISQNFFLGEYTKLRAFYDQFKFRSLVIETDQSGMPLEDFATVVPHPDGLVAFMDGDRCPFNQLPGYESDISYGWAKLGRNFNRDAPWYRLCYLYALEPELVIRPDSFIGDYATYQIELPEPDLTMEWLSTASDPIYPYISVKGIARYILNKPSLLGSVSKEVVIEVLNQRPELTNQMSLSDIPLDCDPSNADLLLYLIRNGRIDGTPYYEMLWNNKAVALNELPETLKEKIQRAWAEPKPPRPVPGYIYLTPDERDRYAINSSDP